MLNYSWKASPNRWGRLEFNATFSIGFGNELRRRQAASDSSSGTLPDYYIEARLLDPRVEAWTSIYVYGYIEVPNFDHQQSG